jgi:hypothetical protein
VLLFDAQPQRAFQFGNPHKKLHTAIALFTWVSISEVFLRLKQHNARSYFNYERSFARAVQKSQSRARETER